MFCKHVCLSLFGLSFFLLQWARIPTESISKLTLCLICKRNYNSNYSGDNHADRHTQVCVIYVIIFIYTVTYSNDPLL